MISKVLFVYLLSICCNLRNLEVKLSKNAKKFIIPSKNLRPRHKIVQNTISRDYFILDLARFSCILKRKQTGDWNMK